MFGVTKADVFVILVLVAILIFYVKRQYGEVVRVTASRDGRRYLCLKLPDQQEAAERLAEVTEAMIALVRHMVAIAPDDVDAKRLFSNFNPDAIHEGNHESSYTSFSVNKGESITLCIRQRDNSFVPINTVVYVAFHELAHLMTETVGHDPVFWDNFKRLLTEAISIGLYQKIDFDKKPEPYCGIQITSSVI